MDNNTKAIQIVEFDQKKLEAAYAAKDGLSELIEKIRNKAIEVREELPDDLSILANRKKYKSLGASIGTFKAALEKTGKALVDAKKKTISETQNEINMINASKNSASEELKQLREEMTAPARDWENAEQERKDKIKEKLNVIEGYKERLLNGKVDSMSSGTIETLISELKAIEIDDLHEFREEGENNRAMLLHMLSQALIIANHKEDEAKRIQQENLEKEKREREEREARIRKEAAEKADNRRRQKLSDSVESIRKHGECLDDNPSSEFLKVVLSNLDGIVLSAANFDEYLSEAIEAHRESTRLVKSAIEKAVLRESEEKKKAEEERLLRVEREVKARLERDQERQAEEERLRQADAANRERVHDEILEDMKELKFNDEIAKKLLLHIRMDQIRNVVIRY